MAGIATQVAGAPDLGAPAVNRRIGRVPDVLDRDGKPAMAGARTLSGSDWTFLLSTTRSYASEPLSREREEVGRPGRILRQRVGSQAA